MNLKFTSEYRDVNQKITQDYKYVDQQIHLQLLCNMPADSLSLSIRISCQQHLVTSSSSSSKISQPGFSTVPNGPDQGPVILRFYRPTLACQVTHVAIASNDLRGRV